MQHSNLATPQTISPLTLQAVVRPRGSRTKRSAVTAVMLTSLIDAFTTLVIFCIMNPLVANDNVKLERGMQLPAAMTSEMMENIPVVRVGANQYFINDKPTTKESLKSALSQFGPTNEEEKKTKAIILQADKRDQFSGFNPVILAAAQNGIQKFQFLVVTAGEGK
jgi:biopolymer transport protein ExbD